MKDTHVDDSWQRRHVPDLFHSREESAHAWINDKTKHLRSDGDFGTNHHHHHHQAKGTSSAGVTQLLEHQLLQRIVHIEVTFHLK